MFLELCLCHLSGRCSKTPVWKEEVTLAVNLCANAEHSHPVRLIACLNSYDTKTSNAEIRNSLVCVCVTIAQKLIAPKIRSLKISSMSCISDSVHATL